MTSQRFNHSWTATSRAIVARAAACLSILVVIAAIASPAVAKQARCAIKEAGGGGYTGPCTFSASAGGSFVVTPVDGEPDLGGRLAISVDIIEPGVADVRGLTLDGINSRWGQAIRSEEDPACWVGEDFAICVY